MVVLNRQQYLTFVPITPTAVLYLGALGLLKSQFSVMRTMLWKLHHFAFSDIYWSQNSEVFFYIKQISRRQTNDFKYFCTSQWIAHSPECLTMSVCSRLSYLIEWFNKIICQCTHNSMHYWLTINKTTLKENAGDLARRNYVWERHECIEGLLGW